jgi:hypothetical protein
MKWWMALLIGIGLWTPYWIVSLVRLILFVRESRRSDKRRALARRHMALAQQQPHWNFEAYEYHMQEAIRHLEE